MNNTKIVLVDDHTILREALASVINQFDGCAVMFQASTGKELINKIQQDNPPDLILLDIQMPELDGFGTAKWLKEYYPDVKILVLTMYYSEIALIRFLKLGVRGILKKDIHPSELKRAIDATMNTGYYYSGSTSSILANLLNADEISLSDNEMRLLELVCSELTYKEIALLMKVSPRTIDNYRDALFSKLNVKSRAGLILVAMRNGLIKVV